MPFLEDSSGQSREHEARFLALAALESYPLEVSRIELLADYTNTLFRVDTHGEGRWVVRVGISGPVAHSDTVINSEMLWLEAIHRDTGLTAPRPLRNRHGSLVTAVTIPSLIEPRTCVVFSWMPGRLLAESLGRDEMHALGAYEARLHAYGAEFRPPPEFSIPRYDKAFPYERPVVLFDNDHQGLMKGAMRDRCIALRDRIEVVTQRLSHREPVRVIHGDLYQWNALVHRGEIGVFDFEDLLWGWPVQDIAGTFFTLWDRDDYPELQASFRSGYETVADWPEKEPGEIATFVAGRSLVLANDVLQQPETRHEAGSILTDAAQRIEAVLGQAEDGL